jgi:hypothetical protein
MKFHGKACLWALVLVAVIGTGAMAGAEKGYLWDGSHWKDMSRDLKIAYVKGVGNMADFETAAGGAGRGACISKAFVDELKNKTVAQVVADVDNFYKENPTKEKTPVIVVILQRSTKICPPQASEKK